jgi:hypothetical protein
MFLYSLRLSPIIESIAIPSKKVSSIPTCGDTLNVSPIVGYIDGDNRSNNLLTLTQIIYIYRISVLECTPYKKAIFLRSLQCYHKDIKLFVHR